MIDYRHDIEKYIKGELSPAERHALEKKALSDPFLADALEGAEQIGSKYFSSDVASLKESVLGKKTISIWMWPARVAAGLAIIAVSTYIVWIVTTPESMQDLALKKKEQPIPSVTTDSVAPAAETPSTPAAEPSEAGPSTHNKNMASRSMNAQAETKPQTDNEFDKKTKANEDIQTIIEEKKVEETKAAEPSAQVKQMEKALDENYKADDVQRARKLASSEAKKKVMPSSKDLAQPSQGSRTAGAVIVVSNIVAGQVTSAEDGASLPGINVIIKGTTQGTATDENGNYRITVPHTNAELNFSFIGLQSIEVKVGERNEVNVQMGLDVTQLSEVVVTGYGSQSDESPPPTINLAHPEIGNRTFKQYLEKNIRYPEQAKAAKTEGRVTVEFTIEPSGALTNFVVLLSIGSGCDEELIRLIKEGPRWVPTLNDGMSVQDKARVRLKFVLPK